MAELEHTLAALAIDYWKLQRAFERLVLEVASERKPRLLAQARFTAGRLATHLEAAGMEVACFDGQEITPSVPVTAINAEEYPNAGRLVIADTLEPTIVVGSRVLAVCRVIAAPGEA